MHTGQTHHTEVLATIDASSISTILSEASDLALVIDPSGLVLEVLGKPELRTMLGASLWFERPIYDLFGKQDACKIEDIVAGVTPSCTVDHVARNGTFRTLKYTAHLLPGGSSAIVFGRDETRYRFLQRQLTDTRLETEALLEKRRQDADQYRKLFAIGAEAVMVVDITTLRVIEANRAAHRFLGTDTLADRPVRDLVDGSDRASIVSVIKAAHKSQSPLTVPVTLASGAKTTLRVEVGSHKSGRMLLQLSQPQTETPTEGIQHSVLELVRAASDGIVVVDALANILWANETFTENLGASSPASLVGLSMQNFVDASECDVEELLENILKFERVRSIPTSLQNRSGERMEMELSAVCISSEDNLRFGLFFRDISTRLHSSRALASDDMPEALAWDQLGKASLHELVRAEVDVTEKRFLIAALKLTGNNRSAAAQLLGLSRQGLYSKLKKYEID